MTGIEALIAAAAAVRANAYAPYSGFAVGAAVQGEDGRIHLGVNVENASYPAGLCAEAAALAALVAAGGRRVTAVAVVAGAVSAGAGAAVPVPPCGLCLQRLSELAGPDTPVHLCTPAGRRESLTLGALLPRAFAAEDLAG